MKHNKEGILLHGMYYLWENGYYNSGISDILNSCQLPKGSFYNFFKSKEDFCIEVLDLYCNIMHTSMDEYLSDKTYNPIDRLKNFYINQIELSFNQNLVKGCLMCNLSLELGSSHKKMKKELTRHLQTNLSLIEKCLTEAETKAKFNEDFMVGQAAEFVQNNWFGALLKTKAMGKVEPLNEFLDFTFELLSPN